MLFGNVELLQNPSIAIVGSRDASEYGKKFAAQFASSIARSNITIVSGMAVGIDGVAHKNSIDEVGKTIAVMGSGFNNIFPKENECLFKEIIDKGGLVISEYSPNTKPNLKNFPFRNRIIAGLSMAVLVVEAKFRSGSSITARYAFKEQKQVFCLPHSLDDINGVGTNNLLKAGAKLITKPQEIGEFLNIKIDNVKKVNKKVANLKKNVASKVEKIKDIKDIKNIENIESIENIEKIEELEDDYKIIYKALLNGQMNVNALSNKLNLPISTLNGYLTIMEIKGYIVSLPGNEVKIKEL